jgi:hypothetical protein
MLSAPSSRLRVALAALGVALALATLADYRALRAVARAMVAQLAASGRDDADTPEGFGSEPDPERVRLLAARALYYGELAGSGAGAAERAASAARLATVARLAGGVLARRPASWEAAMLAGGATYLGWAQAHDVRLYTEHARWEEPLLAAIRLAPGKPQPSALLAAAYLETWPHLAPAKRREARALLARVFSNPDDFSRLIGPWLDVAADRRDALSLVPALPAFWERLEDAFARRHDWEGFADARRRWDGVLTAQLRRDLAEADLRLRGGDPRSARELLLSVLARARPDTSYQPLVATALARCPPGPVDRRTAVALAPLLAWAVDRCVYDDCPFAAAALKRLGRFAGDSDPGRQATAALFAGDVALASALERDAQGVWEGSWPVYLVAKARLLAAAGRVEEAAQALSLVERPVLGGPLYWRARQRLAEASGDLAGAARAAAEVAAMARRDWPPAAWMRRENRGRLELLVAQPAAGVALDLDVAHASGGVVELRLDGTHRGAFPALPDAAMSFLTTLSLDAPLAPGLHLLEYECVAGSGITPAAVRLLP